MADDDETKDNLARRVRTAAARGGEATTIAAESSEEFQADLEDRLASLRAQLADIARQVEDFAENRLSDTRDLARRAGRRTAVAARSMRDEPIPVVVALGVLALLAAVLLVRSRDDRGRHSWMR